jgi:DNA-binding PadR family transcriptional regulator
MSSTGALTPFSYVILVLVGRGGAGPHDLRRMSEQGSIYWNAAPSQWYAEPKRLAALGYLHARKEPGRTRERTHYELTASGREALAAWVRTPAGLARVQRESIIRLLAADLVEPAAVLEGLRAMRAPVEQALAGLARAPERRAGLEHRREMLALNDRYGERLLRLELEWLTEACDLLERRTSETKPKK